jgi:flagellar biogenesis protein FliO
MKIQCLEASIITQSPPRICAPSSACLQAFSGARQLIDFPGEASAISLQNAKELCSGAWLNARKQLTRVWRNASSLLFQTKTNASEWFSRAWKTSFALISRGCANSIKQSSRVWKRIRAQQIARSKSKRLQVAETVSLGEKRFVAVIKVDGREFLIGGGATSVALLAQLDGRKQMGVKKQLNAKTSFDEILTEKMTVPRKQPAKQAKKKAAQPPVEKVEGQL